MKRPKKKKKIETTDPNSGEIRGSSMQVESRMCVCMHVYRQTNNGVCLVKKKNKGTSSHPAFDNQISCLHDRIIP